MGILGWGDSRGEAVRVLRLTISCEDPGADKPSTQVTFGLSPSYGIRTPRDAHAWFLKMTSEHDEFEVETDRAGETPMPFRSATVRQVVVE